MPDEQYTRRPEDQQQPGDGEEPVGPDRASAPASIAPNEPRISGKWIILMLAVLVALVIATTWMILSRVGEDTELRSGPEGNQPARTTDSSDQAE